MKPLLIIACSVFALGACTISRSLNSITTDDINGFSSCLSKSEITDKLGGVDRRISIPGGGRIEVHDVMVRNRYAGNNASSSIGRSIITLGIADLTAGLNDAISDCQANASTGTSTLGSKCDYKKLRFFIHYADEETGRVSCFERKEIWAGSFAYSHGDDSKCPIEYKQDLSELIDTSEFPNATLSWPPGTRSVQEQLRFMADDHAAHC